MLVAGTHVYDFNRCSAFAAGAPLEYQLSPSWHFPSSSTSIPRLVFRVAIDAGYNLASHISQLTFYGAYHSNRINVLIHIICVPILLWLYFLHLLLKNADLMSSGHFKFLQAQSQSPRYFLQSTTNLMTIWLLI
jgi:Protein of unknown function (DUF962)